VSPSDQAGGQLKIALCTRKYPPEVYGGAGVHVEYLAKELSRHVDLTVLTVASRAHH
jgi:alpha-maltose-1-phosphate synthase